MAAPEPGELLELARRAVKAAIGQGAEQAEAYVSFEDELRVDIEGAGIKHVSHKVDTGIGVRAYFRGGMGFSYALGLDVKRAEEVGRTAARLSKVAEPDPDFRSLPDPRRAEDVPGLYDPELANAGADEVIGWTRELIGAARSVREVVLRGDVTRSYSLTALANSLGVEVVRRGTAVHAYVLSICREGGDVGSSYEWDGGRALKDVDFAGVGETVARESLDFLRATTVKTGEYPAVIHFDPTYRFFHTLLATGANAENVQRKRSYLVGMLGEKIAPEYLTVVDDGRAPGGIHSSPYDDEGVPKRRVTVIEGGVLKEYLHNSYTAGKEGIESNGCAFREGYATPPEIGPSNIRIEPGDMSLDDMVREMGTGVIIYKGMLIPDPVTGEISHSLDFGFWVEGGEVKRPLRGVFVGSSALDLLRGIDAISREAREEPGLKIPAIRVKSIRVSGG